MKNLIMPARARLGGPEADPVGIINDLRKRDSSPARTGRGQNDIVIQSEGGSVFKKFL